MEENVCTVGFGLVNPRPKKPAKPKSNFKVYTIKNIQRVYRQHALKCGSVVYSTDGGYTWQSVPMDSGKWGSGMEPMKNWVFAFLA